MPDAADWALETILTAVARRAGHRGRFEVGHEAFVAAVFVARARQPCLRTLGHDKVTVSFHWLAVIELLVANQSSVGGFCALMQHLPPWVNRFHALEHACRNVVDMHAQEFVS